MLISKRSGKENVMSDYMWFAVTGVVLAANRDFLHRMGIMGEIVSTPSHSEDSVSLILDSGDCIIGDLETYEYLDAYEDNEKLKGDWERILAFKPKRIFFAHRPERKAEE